MAVTSRELHDKGVFHRQAAKPVPIVRSYRTSSRAPYLLTLLLCVIAVMLTANSVIGWVRTSLDDVRYGRPRTMQLSGFVGHEEAAGIPSQFIAMNMNRRHPKYLLRRQRLRCARTSERNSSQLPPAPPQAYLGEQSFPVQEVDKQQYEYQGK